METGVTSGAFLINVGRQMIFGDIFTFDISAGIGYGGSSITNSSTNSWESRTQYYSHFLPSDGSFAATFSFSIGVLLK